MKIFLFKTDVKNDYQKKMVAPVINQIKGINRWSFDLEDKNKVLRVEGHGLKPQQIEEMISNAGFKCETMY
ncbi:MAG: hypothetical protein A3F72_16040 [Bacteroidetes bacterium RIFCSPLOWO2_12_FULL_35_15]|nr:MAG: hypothetical protein A3F72_16040 [Bacteroidetes bacterium RIFCSPLOWO2_12_FULL_35_15]